MSSPHPRYEERSTATKQAGEGETNALLASTKYILIWNIHDDVWMYIIVNDDGTKSFQGVNPIIHLFTPNEETDFQASYRATF